METTQSIFVKALEHHKYYEALHLFLARWQKLHKCHAKDENIYKAFINGAATFDLIIRGKYKAAKRVWKIYEKYRPLIQEDIDGYIYFKKADSILLHLKDKYQKVFDSERVTTF